ncbi:hypothetical protein OIO90_003836 [Microbotryomycetes sp. JL221]|nr:hypothetical protein OIO90_003836 [Microbotryomycetes sp. JL221]
MDSIDAWQRQWAAKSSQTSSSNPFQALSERTASWLYGNPDTPYFSSFKSRLIVLMVIIAYLCLSGFIATGLHILSRRRSQRTLWIVKRVIFPDGTPVVIFEQFALIFVFSCILLPVVGLCHIGTATNVFLNRASQKDLNGWRLAAYSPIFLCVWFMAVPRIFRGRHLNLVTIGGGTLLASFLVALSAAGGYQGRKIWSTFLKLQDTLQAAAVEYDAGTISNEMIATAGQAYTRWRGVLSTFYGIFKAMLSVFAVGTVAAASVIVCTFTLVLLLRKQIRESIDNIAVVQAAVVDLAACHESETAVEPKVDNVVTPVSSPDSGQTLAPTELTRAQIRKAAKGQGQLGIEQGQAQRLVDLTRVERERIITCVVGFAFCVAIEVYCLFSLVIISRRRRTWAENEVILTCYWWMCSVIGSVATTALAINELIHLPPKQKRQPTTTSSGRHTSSAARQVKVDVVVSREIHTAVPGDEEPEVDDIVTWTPVQVDEVVGVDGQRRGSTMTRREEWQ